ncbi:hypothetical protein TNCV_1857901 [Trichonephila clavipes]|nr:hypothetical protein TNCV_1857901 [Trichonephila clavipes]
MKIRDEERERGCVRTEAPCGMSSGSLEPQLLCCDRPRKELTNCVYRRCIRPDQSRLSPAIILRIASDRSLDRNSDCFNGWLCNEKPKFVRDFDVERSFKLSKSIEDNEKIKGAGLVLRRRELEEKLEGEGRDVERRRDAFWRSTSCALREEHRAAGSYGKAGGGRALSW